MGALTIISPGGLPPARRALVDITRRINDARRHLDRLQSGKAALEREIGRVVEARSELQALVAADSASLVDKLRSGATWALSAITQARTHSVAERLSQSRVEASVAETALKSVAGEVGELERSISEMQASKADLVRSVLLESAGGFRSDLATAIENLREAMTVLCALDRITARSDGSYVPTKRVVVEIGALGGLPAQAVVVPEVSIVAALRVWGKYSQALGDNPLSSADEMKFPSVDPRADDGLVSYDLLSPTERNRVDQLHAQGVKSS
jgi:hypothetical protein